MARLTKKQKEAAAKIEKGRIYSIEEASALIKDVTNTKFDASIDLAVRLGVDPRKANQMVRGVVTLPHGTGKDVKVLALVTPDKEQEAKDAGADFVGLDEYITKIEGGWTDIDVIITMPTVMAKDQFFNTQAQVSVNYVKIPYSSIVDSTLNLSDADLKAYMNANYKQFEKDASVDLKLVSFPIVASENDRLEAEKWMKIKVADWKTEENDSLFINLYRSLYSKMLIFSILIFFNKFN